MIAAGILVLVMGLSLVAYGASMPQDPDHTGDGAIRVGASVLPLGASLMALQPELAAAAGLSPMASMVLASLLIGATVAGGLWLYIDHRSRLDAPPPLPDLSPSVWRVRLRLRLPASLQRDQDR